MKNLTQEQLTELESQLSHPNGEFGLEVAENMHSTNIGMTTSAINALEISDHNKILEIGHGSCQHLPLILEKAEGITFYGLEISETMKTQAELKNEVYLKNQTAEFKLYDGESIPFSDNFFEKAMTVNTLYFWKHPLQFLEEVYRVMKPKGVFTISFAHKEFMQHLPFVKDKFSLYSNQDVSDLVAKSSFELLNIYDKTETVTGNAGELVNRNYAVAVLAKK
ncbi:class I SAM-dependent methyltransferase [uncultured Roseivirga sp.]|uniref:class I SAM-dependent methyltransferase n=1 Tax=uncultured Roseivirga sp. TaxID=543088 RepID=UPI0030DA0619